MNKKILSLIIIVPALMRVAGAIAVKPDLEDLMKANGKAYSAIDKGIAKGRFDGLADQAQGIFDKAVLISHEYEPPIHQEKREKFRALAAQLAQDAQRLKAALPKANPIESKKLLKTMEKTCISCHQTFVPKKK